MEQVGSEKAYAFCVPAHTGRTRVAVYEACVDVLAHMTLEQGSRDKYRLELGGISAPKEGQSQRSMKKPQEHTFTKKIGQTVYVVRYHFNENAKESMQEKICAALDVTLSQFFCEEDMNNCTSHSRYFSDELDVQFL